jgi:polyhydroxyalkanoate synthesis regulator protein
MQRRVKNLDKMTKEVLTQIALWEEANDGNVFLYGVWILLLWSP